MSTFYQDKVFSVELIDNSYYKVIVFENQEFTTEDLKKLVEAQKKNNELILPVLVFCENNAQADAVLLAKLSKNKNNPYSKADAFIINSLAQKILANFYVKINKPERPTKFFDKEDEALEWLKQYI